MKKALSIFAVFMMFAGTTAMACDSCGCQAKKAEKSKCCKGEEKKTACGETKKVDTEYQVACGGSKKGDDGKKSA